MDIKPLITADEIDAKLAEIGKRISEDYAGKEVLLVGVLRGAFMVMADLARHIDLACEFDFMAVSSYGASVGEPTRASPSGWRRADDASWIRDDE
jgi:hypoxanthine phosphoribosyltransferase